MTRRWVFATLCAWLVLSVSLWATHARPTVFALGGIIVAAGAAMFVASDMAKRIRRVDWLPGVRHRAAGAVDPRVVALRRQIDAARWSGSTELHDTLVALTDDRLSAHHGLDRAVAPAEAEMVLSPNLRRLVDGSGDAVSTRDLRRILIDLEAL